MSRKDRTVALRPLSYGNIVIDGDFPDTLQNSRFMTPENYQLEVLDRLVTIDKQTKSGAALLRGLRSLVGKVVRIIPAPYAQYLQTITKTIPASPQNANPNSSTALITYNP